MMNDRSPPARFGLIAIALFLAAAHPSFAQSKHACLCAAPGTETLHEPDTVFHVVDRFDAAFCGHIDRSVSPFVYSDFTLRSCITTARTPLRVQGPAHACLIAVSGGMLVVDELRALPDGLDLSLVPTPCWRTNYVLRVHEDTAQYAINAMKQLIAGFPRPTPEQFTRVQGRWDARTPAIYWTDQELLGQVFLCALFEPAWYRRFTELRDNYMLGGAAARYYDELLEILHEKRARTAP